VLAYTYTYGEPNTNTNSNTDGYTYGDAKGYTEATANSAPASDTAVSG
jgi:hypothetical protein